MILLRIKNFVTVPSFSCSDHTAGGRKRMEEEFESLARRCDNSSHGPHPSCGCWLSILIIYLWALIDFPDRLLVRLALLEPNTSSFNNSSRKTNRPMGWVATEELVSEAFKLFATFLAPTSWSSTRWFDHFNLFLFCRCIFVWQFEIDFNRCFVVVVVDFVWSEMRNRELLSLYNIICQYHVGIEFHVVYTRAFKKFNEDPGHK